MRNRAKEMLEHLRKQRQLTNDDLVGDIPLFVDHARDGLADTKCGACTHRILGTPDTCAIMEGSISLRDGVCNYWKQGGQAGLTPTTGPHPSQMTKVTAGYVETPGKVICASCRHYSPNLCKLWNAQVKSGDCCLSWEK